MRTRRLTVLLAVCLATLIGSTDTLHAQRGPRGGYVGARRVVYVGGHYSPFFYDPFFNPFWYPYSFYGPPPYGFAGYPDTRSSLKLQVSPRQAEVFVDGYVAGTVDDFDGTFQRLPVTPGEHEIVLFLGGYRTVRQRIYVTPGSTYRIRHTMETLAPGETTEPRPDPPLAPQVMPPPRSEPSTQGSSGIAAQAAGFGTISLRVQPADAEVLIDGELWQASGPQDRLSVQVSGGTHRLEVRKDGYRPYSSEVQVVPGGTATVNVSLSKLEQ